MKPELFLIKPGDLGKEELSNPEHPGIVFLKQLSKEYRMCSFIHGKKLRYFTYKKNSVIVAPYLTYTGGIFLRFKSIVKSIFWQCFLFLYLIFKSPKKVISMGGPTELIIPWVYSYLFNREITFIFAGWPEIEKSTNSLSRLLTFIMLYLLKKQKIKKIFVVSKDLQYRLIKKGVNKETIITFDYERNKDSNFLKSKFKFHKKDKFIILFVGRLVLDKGIYDIIKIAKKLKIKFKEFKILILGEGPEKNNFLIKIKKNELSDYITLVGHKKYKELPYYFKSADILLFPSHFEPLGQVAIEALLSGIPVVGSNIGGIKETIESNKTGFLVKPKDIDGFVKSIIKIKDPTIYNKLKKNIIYKQKGLISPKMPLFQLVKLELDD